MEVRFQKKFQAYYKKVAGQFSLNFRLNILHLDFGNCFLCFSGLSRLALPTTGNKNSILHKITNFFRCLHFSKFILKKKKGFLRSFCRTTKLVALRLVAGQGTKTTEEKIVFRKNYWHFLLSFEALVAHHTRIIGFISY